MTEKTYNTGDDILCMCLKCQMVLNHLVSAAFEGKPINIICKTCKTSHKYSKKKDPNMGKINLAKKVPKKINKIKDKDIDFAMIKGDKKKYNLKSMFSKGDVILHPKFGIGLVKHDTSSNIEVFFKCGTKILMHNVKI